jgi:hypothetical protein
MDRFYTTVLGSYQDQDYYLTVSGEPSINDIRNFAVTFHYDDPQTTTQVEIARIDTSHGYVHFDRLYRADQRTDSVDMETPWEAENHLREHWRQYAASYARNHA